MELSQYVEGLRRELGSLTRFAPAEVTKLADQLAESLDSPVRLTLLEALSAAAAEITESLDATVIELRLAAGEPEFVATTIYDEPDEPAGASEPTADEAGTTRVTLRLSEALKTRIETRAAASGLSVNAWLVNAAVKALENPSGKQNRTRSGQRITGYARS